MKRMKENHYIFLFLMCSSSAIWWIIDLNNSCVNFIYQLEDERHTENNQNYLHPVVYSGEYFFFSCKTNFQWIINCCTDIQTLSYMKHLLISCLQCCRICWSFGSQSSELHIHFLGMHFATLLHLYLSGSHVTSSAIQAQKYTQKNDILNP